MKCEISWALQGARSCDVCGYRCAQGFKGQTGMRRDRRTKVYLRTQQFHYLEYVAERDEITLSKAFASVLDSFKSTHKPTLKPTNYKRVLCMALTADEHAFLARVATDRGVKPSIIARQIIDMVMADDPLVNG